MLSRETQPQPTAALTAKAEPAPKPPPAEPDFSKFADRDFTEGMEIDDSQEWIREELERRMRRIDAGEEKFYTVEETMQWLEKYKHEYRSNQAMMKPQSPPNQPHDR